VGQVSDEMHARIIIWHEEKHLSPKEIADLAGCCVRTVYSERWSASRDNKSLRVTVKQIQIQNYNSVVQTAMKDTVMFKSR
jgi:hypothetical protein